MTAKDWFGVVVRTIGLWSIFKAALNVLGVFTVMGTFFGGMLYDSTPVKPGGTTGALMFIVLEIGMGFLMLRKADAIVGFAFPAPPIDSDPTLN